MCRVGAEGFWWKKPCELQSPLPSYHLPRPLVMGCVCVGGRDEEKILLYAKAKLMKHSPWKWLFSGPCNLQKEASRTGHAVPWWWECTTSAPFACIWVLDWRPFPIPFPPPKPPPCTKALPTALDNEEEDVRRSSSCMTMILLKGWAVGFFFSFHFSLGNHLHMLLDCRIRLLYIENAIPTIFRRQSGGAVISASLLAFNAICQIWFSLNFFSF